MKSITKDHTPVTTDRPRLIRLPEVKTRIGLSRSTIYNRIADKTFPAPITLSGKSVAWLESDIDDWINCKLVEAGREVSL